MLVLGLNTLYVADNLSPNILSLKHTCFGSEIGQMAGFGGDREATRYFHAAWLSAKLIL